MKTEKANFPGELREINPSRLIDKNNFDRVETFFLVMGLFYNDLKSLNFHLMQVGKLGKSPDISVETGEYWGMKAHLERLIVATIYEFFQFLKNSDDVLKTAEFELIYESLNRDLRSKWDVIIEIAREESVKKATNFTKILVLIRNNLAFHYRQSARPLRRGFVDFFFLDEKNPANEKAYYSTGETMSDTRFFYCDAAAQKSFRIQIEKKMSYEEFLEGLDEVIGDLNFTIMRLMRKYIRQRPSK